MRRLPLHLVLALALAFVLFVGCKGSPGQECSDTPGSCNDKSSHLVCVNKIYVLETCKGQGGCNGRQARR